VLGSTLSLTTIAVEYRTKYSRVTGPTPARRPTTAETERIARDARRFPVRPAAREVIAFRSLPAAELCLLLPFPDNFVEPPLDFVLRQPTATYHYPGLPVHVANVLERIPLHQD
jgi:hypothetical protein